MDPCENCGRQLSASGMCQACLLGMGLERPNTEVPKAMREFGAFTLLEEIGRGGMGVVFRAQERSLDRPVALKVMAMGLLATPEALRRFRAEALAAAAMSHPNIVPIYDVGEHDGQAYMSMRFMGNGTIEQFQGSPANAVRLVHSIAKAVQHAHERGILHCDLKPANILLDEEGTPYLTDFGISKALSVNDNAQTRTQSIMGSPAYLAPEQAAGRKQLTTATDVHGLGTILYQLLTGQPPFSGATALETIRDVIDEPPERLSAIVPDLDRDLETICLKCLQKEPENRYASPVLLAEELESWQNGEPILARPTGRMERTTKWIKRRPYLGALAVVTSVLLLTIIVGALAFGVQQQRANTLTRSSAETNRALAMGLIEDTAIDKINDGDLFAALPWLADTLKKDTGNPEREQLQRTRIGVVRHHAPRLIETWPIGGSAHYLTESGDIAVHDPKEGVVHLLSVDDDSRLPVKISVPAPSSRMAAIPNGTLVATLNSDHLVRAWDTQTLKQTSPDLEAVNNGHIAFSPDGRWLAYGGGRDQYSILVWNTDDWTTAFTIPTEYHPRCLTFTPDSKTVVAGGTVRNIGAWDLETGEQRLASESRNGFANVEVIAMPDRVIASTGLGITCIPFDEDASRSFTTGHWIFDMAVSNDEKLLAYGGRDTFAHIVELDSGRPNIPPIQHSHAVTSVAFSQDDRALLTSSGDGTVTAWDAATGRRLHAPLRHEGDVTSALFNKDATEILVSTTEATYLWSVIAEPLAGPILRLPTIRRAAFADDAGEDLLTVDDANTLHRWQVGTGLETGNVASLSSQDIDRVHYDFELPVTHPSGKAQLIGVSSGQLRLVETGTEKPLSQPIRHREEISFASFSDDGLWIITGSADRTARVWDAESGKAITPPLSTNGEVFHAILSRDKRRLAVFSRNASVSVWRLDPSETPMDSTLHDSVAQKHIWAWNRAVQTLEQTSLEDAVNELDVIGNKAECLATQARFIALYGTSAKAIPLLKEAVAALPDRSEQWKALGRCLIDQEQWQEAETCFQKALDNHDVSASCLLDLGACQLRLGQVEEAKATAAAALAADPGSARALELAGRIAETQRNWPTAIAQYEQGARMRRLAMMPDSVPRSVEPDPFGKGTVSIAPYQNDILEEYPFSPHIALQPLAHLGKGLVTFHNLPFILQGAIRLNGTGDVPNNAPYPVSVLGIPIRQMCQKVHLLHTFQHFEKVGAEVATVEFVFANGHHERLPLLYGHHGYECNYAHGKIPLDPGTLIAWEKQVPDSQIIQSVYLTTWDNPHPELEIAMVHFHSAMKITCPILYAVTVE